MEIQELRNDLMYAIPERLQLEYQIEPSRTEAEAGKNEPVRNREKEEKERVKYGIRVKIYGSKTGLGLNLQHGPIFIFIFVRCCYANYRISFFTS
jgi:hypothetical protein